MSEVRSYRLRVAEVVTETADACSLVFDSPDQHLFLRSVTPHGRLADHATVHRVIATVFAKAGVTDVKAGTRRLRHNAATRLLRASVPLPTISAVLGHANPESTDLYLSVDQDRLLECVLDVPDRTRS